MTLNGDEIRYGFINFGDGCFDDSKSDKGSQNIVDSLPNDPFDMEFDSLPRDPFGMDFNEALVEVITGWIEDLGLKDYGLETDEDDKDNSSHVNRLKAAEEDDSSGEDNSVFVVWTGLEYEQGEDWESEEVDVDSMENNSFVVDDSLFFGCEKYENEDVNNVDGGLEGHGFKIDEFNVVWTGSTMEYDWEADADPIVYTENYSYVLEDSWCFGCEKYEIENVKDVTNGGGDEGAAADMIIFVLGYLNLGVKDLLTIEMVCKSLRDAVRKDPYLWTKIHIDSPLNDKISNDDLLRLTDRAQGKLCSLGLVKCLMITDDGLQKVLERNLELTKLSVAGSIKLSVEGVLKNLKAFNSIAKPGIKHLRIADIKHLRIGEPIGITNEHLREFKLLLGADEDAEPNNHKSRFYRAEEIYLSLDDERAIDIETCPRCQILRQVYDCPTENCRVTSNSMETCKACIYCIARCIQCGCCLDDKAYEELFSFEFRCFDCLRVFLEAVKLSPGQSYFHPMTSYHFIVYS